MIEMKLNEYCEKNKSKLELGRGLPEGDTFFNKDTEINEVQKEFEGKTKTVWEITAHDGKKYIVGKGVINGISIKLNNGHSVIRVTRSGTTKTDTRYTFLGLAEMPAVQITKETHY